MNDDNVWLRKMRKLVFLLGITKIPMIGFANPKLKLISDERVEVRMKLNWKTKNHLSSMYFGALAIGADLTGGIHAFYFARKLGVSVSFAFKGLKADFIKRAETDTLFVCTDGLKLKSAVEKSIETGERYNEDMHVTAYNTSNEEVATFELVASVKVKPR